MKDRLRIQNMNWYGIMISAAYFLCVSFLVEKAALLSIEHFLNEMLTWSCPLTKPKDFPALRVVS